MVDDGERRRFQNSYLNTLNEDTDEQADWKEGVIEWSRWTSRWLVSREKSKVGGSNGNSYAKGGACDDEGEGLDLEACPYFC